MTARKAADGMFDNALIAQMMAGQAAMAATLGKVEQEVNRYRDKFHESNGHLQAIIPKLDLITIALPKIEDRLSKLEQAGAAHAEAFKLGTTTQNKIQTDVESLMAVKNQGKGALLGAGSLGGLIVALIIEGLRYAVGK